MSPLYFARTVLALVLGGAALIAILAIRRLVRVPTDAASPTENVDEPVLGDSQFALIFNSAPVAMMIVRIADGRIAVVNHACCELWGYTRDEFEGRTSTELQLWIEPVQFIKTLTENRNSDSHELPIREKSGNRRDALVSVTMIQLAGCAHLLITAADITPQKRAQVMEHIAHHDTLTNLPNRLLLHSKLQEVASRIDSAGVLGALLFVDLDGFKRVNDTLGHAAGDELLRLVSARLQHDVRAEDMVARIGGDEFVVLLSNLRHLAEARGVGEMLLKKLNEPFTLPGYGQVSISASIGIRYLRPGETDMEATICEADAALYQAKRAGKGRVRVYQSVADAPLWRINSQSV
ncbi:MAG TPA: sensor domain-containing diguanylate cyclase [Steroidobacteraceae bacterium]|nr:sensor domain-containing diguanylate cyclase [Steroidobacteraceae bacterium]